MREHHHSMDESTTSSPSDHTHHKIAKSHDTTGEIMKHHHAFLIALNNTVIQLQFKCFPAFVAYIMEDYSFSYTFTVAALSIGSLCTCTTLIANPLILHLPTNIVYFLFLLVQSLSCLILWYFRHSKAWFLVGVIILCFNENSCYGCSTAVIGAFTTNPNTSHNYLSTLNSGWTIATFMFLGVGWLMQLGGIWLYLEIMFVIYVICAALSIVFLPKQSANAHNLSAISNSNSEACKDEAPRTVNIKDDMRVLFKIKPFWYIMLALVLIFIPWSYFYSTFGLWLKSIFDLDQATFGYIAGLAEGFGNLCGILSVTYLSTSDEDRQRNEGKRCNKLSLQALMLVTGLVMMAASAVIWIVNFTGWYNQMFIFIWIGLYFYGLEACVCAALILMINIVPPLQQARASAMLGIMQSVTLFLGQMTISPLYYHLDGMKWESFLLLIMYTLSTVIIILLNKIMKDRALNHDELIPINKDKHAIQNYT